MRELRVLVVGLTLLACACVKADSAAAPAEGATHQLVGQSGFDFTLQRFPEDTAFKLSSVRGKVVLVDVWATWCLPCRDLLPLYSDLQRRYGERGLQVLALNVDADASQISRFLAEAKVELPILRDPNAAFAERGLKVRMMPTTFFIDRLGTVRSVHEGVTVDFMARSVAEIEALLAEPAK